jgi:DNA-binding response OmpR family regulator
MRILVAEDDPIGRQMVLASLEPLPIDVAVAGDGTDAWRQIQQQLPDLLLLDWRMPGPDGVEICRRLQTLPSHHRPWVILVTANGATADIVLAFAAGADDYVTKPYDVAELRARVRAGLRRVEREHSLVHESEFLYDALHHLRTGPDVVPICSVCRRVRDEQGEWQAPDSYLEAHAGIRFTHGLCPPCVRRALDEAIESREKPE